nr:reverse transcriptase domain-containing protein [Tanacetum cinerariifolium]
MAAKGNGDLPVPDLRTMEKLCQPSLNCRGGPIALIAIQATNFGLKNDMIQQVQNSCQFHGLSGDDANKHLDKFLHVTQSIKVNRVIDDALRLYLFPHSLTHHATVCSITSSFDTEIASLKAEMAEINKNLMRVLQVNQQVKAVTPNYETCGGPHSFNDFPTTIGQTQNVYAVGAYQGSRTPPGNTITNPKEEMKGITTRSGTAYQGPTIPTTSSLPPIVERETEAITFNLDQTSIYSANYNDMTANRIDVIGMACEEYSQEILSFSDVIVSGNPTPYYDPIVSTSSSTLTPFRDSDFLLEEVDAFLALEDDPTSLEVDHSYIDTEGDILLLKAFLNDDPSLPLQIKEISFLKFERN